MPSRRHISGRYHHRSRRAGLGLIDVTITLMIIGVVAAVASPRFAGALEMFRARSAAQQIVADIELARQTARTSSANITTTFTLNPPTYTMAGVEDLKNSGNNYTVNWQDRGFNASFASVSFNDTQSITYNQHGLPLAGSPLVPLTSGTIVVSSGTSQLTITVDPVTGKAALQ